MSNLRTFIVFVLLILLMVVAHTLSASNPDPLAIYRDLGINQEGPQWRFIEHMTPTSF